MCVCTYRRQGQLKVLLQALATQGYVLDHPGAVQVLVADNEVSDATRTLCAEAATHNGLDISYLPEPQRGIAFARNACLQQVPGEADWVAFIDDDEIPDPRWLDELLAARERWQADVVHGPVRPVFAETPPDWIRDGGYFQQPRSRWDGEPLEWPDGKELGSAATNNVLLSARMLRDTGQRFDPRFNLSGGEDKLFFRTLRARGYRIVWAADAKVEETVPGDRSGFAYLWRAQFRGGNLNMRVKLALRQAMDKPVRPMRAWLRTSGRGVQAIASGIGYVLTTLFTRGWHGPRLAAGVLRIATGLGMWASLFRFRYDQYR